MKKTGTLVLIKEKRHPKLGEIVELGSHIFIAGEKVVERGQRDYVVITPIIVCDDEIKQFDLFYSKKRNVVEKASKIYKRNLNFQMSVEERLQQYFQFVDCKKVLINTPQTPQNIIDAIISGELKDGSQVEIGNVFEDIIVPTHDGKVVITWNKEIKQSPLYTEKEVRTLIDTAMQFAASYTKSSKTVAGFPSFKGVHPQDVEKWFEQHKKEITMKYFWEERDIEAGLFIIRESSPVGSENLRFAATVSFKIGFINNPEVDKYCTISFLTDGWVYPIGATKQEVADYLNSDRYGYRVMTKEEVFNILNSSTQGFQSHYFNSKG
jgi:hypothetical protein